MRGRLRERGWKEAGWVHSNAIFRGCHLVSGCRRPGTFHFVIPGLGPGIHAFETVRRQAWMPGPSPGMTSKVWAASLHWRRGCREDAAMHDDRWLGWLGLIVAFL